MRSPLVSVLTICRNDLEGLRATADSVALQSRAPDEWIVLDGGSADGTVEFLGTCPGLTAWRSERDEGIADAFNKVAAMASGEWVVFLNSGDAFADPEVLADLAAVLESSPAACGVVFGDAIEIDPSGQVPPRRIRGTTSLGHGTNPICHQAAFLRRDLQARHPYDRRLRIGMDYDLWHRVSRATDIRHVDRAVCLYRLGGVSSSRAWGEHAILAHAMVDWLNLRDRKLGLSDALRLTGKVLGFRTKKALERVLGEALYRKVKGLSRASRPEERA